MIDIMDLPAVNATLNATATVLLIVGYLLIRRGRVAGHRAAMVAALGCSVLFLISYLTYHAEAGSRRFPGVGWVKMFYLSILATHTALAAVVPFLAVVTVALAFRGDLDRHRRIARWTLPIWIYVSITGVVIYWMLYQMQW